jgi:hypothetical protein
MVFHGFVWLVGVCVVLVSGVNQAIFHHWWWAVRLHIHSLLSGLSWLWRVELLRWIILLLLWIELLLVELWHEGLLLLDTPGLQGWSWILPPAFAFLGCDKRVID